jgi:GNAT superfamily N-acetyltransferase
MINIRKGKSKDYPKILDLIKELALFEKAPEEVTNTVERMNKEEHLFELFVAEKNGDIIGMALYFFAYFTWKGKSLYLDDLYVKKEYRGSGIGSKLLRKIFEVAEKEQVDRLRWQVLDWNEPAIELYDKIDAKLDSEWINCDFNKEGIKKFLKE